MMEENQNQELEQQEQGQQTETVETSTNEQIEKIQAQKAELEQLKKEMFQKDVTFTLKENGLEQFASIVKVETEDELKEVVKTLTQIVNSIKLSAGYIPTDKAKENEYD